jgi:type II secretory pathway pseudopilin PulG
VAVAILAILFSIVVVTGKMTRDSRKQSTARQQLAQIAAAISEYAAFWPAWPTADKGWPHFVPNQVFDPTPPSAFPVLPGFNDYTDLSVPPATWLSSDSTPPTPNTFELNANECLVYALTAANGKGPYLKSDSEIGMQMALQTNGSPLFYPASSGGSTVRQRFVDPWGKPLRYFWVYRDANAYRGYLPVWTASSSAPKAHGFVLESAGPDGKYGNVWQANVTAQDKREAEDNLVISP